MYRVPRATYRIQFNAGFTFADARDIVPYLAELGISDIYASPILKARKGSGHGYDVVDGFFFTYYDKRLPLAPGSYAQVLRECVESLPREGVAIELRELVENDASVPNSKFLKETLWRIYEQDEPFRDALNAAMERIN